MNAKTPGEFLYELEGGESGKFYSMGTGYCQEMERRAKAIRDWQAPAEKTLNDLCLEAYTNENGPHKAVAVNMAGLRACARIGAERERAWFRQWAIDNFDYDVPFTKEMIITALDARGKEQQP